MVQPTEVRASTTSTPAWLAHLPATVLFIDVETTGLHSRDRVVSFAGILLTTADLADGQFALKFGHYIVDPGKKSHPKAEAVHGYSDWLLRHQQSFVEIVETVAELIREADLIVAHNAEFDVGFINAEMAALGRPAITKPIYCTMEANRALYPERPAGLAAIGREIGLSRAGHRHSALEDAWLAMMVYLWQHGCPYRTNFDVFPALPGNLIEPPPIPDGPLPRRRRRPRAQQAG